MDFAMSGNPGRYISIVKGTIAVRRPSNKIVMNLCFLVMTCLAVNPDYVFLNEGNRKTGVDLIKAPIVQ
jgi:hypothetical protein